MKDSKAKRFWLFVLNIIAISLALLTGVILAGMLYGLTQ